MTPNPKTRVLFICIGNSCRSQMAEGFARKYGSDVIIPASAGLAPAMMIAYDTVRAMDDKNIDLRDQFPKGLKQLGRAQFDLLVNMSGFDLPPDPGAPVRKWDVADPVSEDYETHCQIRDEIEGLVMGLILELRRAAGPRRSS
ncbi:MAG: arsenate reductase ArsC [Bryobacteraceae bacterium]|jgi:arsenate reductase (thioredoxin)